MSRKRAVKDRCMDDEESVRKTEVLKAEYHELQRETRAVKKRAQRAKAKKDRLLAEVRFLRRKLKMFKQKDSDPERFQEVFANRFVETRAEDAQFLAAVQASACKEEAAYREDASQPSLSPDCRPGQTSESKPFAAGEFQVFWEPLRKTGLAIEETAKEQPLACSGGLVSALKSARFKNGANGCNTQMTGKRKISWQDQISLKV